MLSKAESSPFQLNTISATNPLMVYDFNGYSCGKEVEG